MSTMWRPCGRRAGSTYPDPLEAAMVAEKAGADAITLHLREDRRHIADHDLFRIASAVKVRINQELAPTEEMVEIALKVKPDEVCFVPERREELTTEGGLDVVGAGSTLAPMIQRLREARVGISLLSSRIRNNWPPPRASGPISSSCIPAPMPALPTRIWRIPNAGAIMSWASRRRRSCSAFATRAKAARALGLKVNAGHGLNYVNVGPIASITGLQWLHIGHAIVARAVMVGMARAVHDMKTSDRRRRRQRRLGRRKARHKHRNYSCADVNGPKS